MKLTRIALSVLLSAGLALPTLAQSQTPKIKNPVVDPFGPGKDQPKREDRGTEPALVDLRPRFEVGQTIKFKMDLNQKSRTLVPALDEKPTESTSTQELGLVFKVKESGSDGSVVELSFSRIKMTKKTEEGEESFDSAQPKTKDAGSDLAPALRTLSGTTFTVHLDADGNVTNIEGGDKLMSLDIFGGAPGLDPNSLPGGLPNPGSQPRPPSIGGPGGGGGQGSFVAAIGSIFSIKKGNGRVSVGEEWTTRDVLDTGLLGKFTMSTTSKLKSHNGADARVSVRGYMEPDTSAGGGVSLVKITDSSYVGDYTWSTREGMLRRMDLNQHVAMEASVGGGLTLTSDMKSVVTRTN
jgi:hypothetical protein